MAIEEGIPELEKALGILDDKQEQYKGFFEDEEALPAEVNSAVDYREKGLQVKSKREAQKGDASLDAFSGDSGCSSQCSTKKTHLPELELPSSDGDFLQWESFWDQFNEMVDSSEIPSVNKFGYLLSEANYQNACELLEQLYGRKERLISAHLQVLLNIVVLDSSTGTGELWTLQDTMLTYVRSLEGLGINGERYSIVLTPTVASTVWQKRPRPRATLNFKHS